MDPYLERPDLWPDFHSNLASEIQAQLNRQITPRYFARLSVSITYEVVEIGEAHIVRPDVSIHQLSPSSEAGTSVAIPPAPVKSRIPLEVPLRLYSVGIRKTDTEQRVTVIEILSPVNKRVGMRPTPTTCASGGISCGPRFICWKSICCGAGSARPWRTRCLLLPIT